MGATRVNGSTELQKHASFGLVAGQYRRNYLELSGDSVVSGPSDRILMDVTLK
jgi:hypothetical protein